MCKTNINSNSACLFLWQSVAIDPGESPNQRGFSMVDVAGGAENQRNRPGILGQSGGTLGLPGFTVVSHAM